MPYTMPTVREIQAKIAAIEEGTDSRNDCPKCDGTGDDMYSNECTACKGTGVKKNPVDVKEELNKQDKINFDLVDKGPLGQEYSATFDSYDGAPDAAEENAIIGWGSTKQKAMNDLLDQADEYTNLEYQDDLDDGQPSSYEEYQDYMGGDDWDHGQFDESGETLAPSRKEIIKSVVKHGPDSMYLYFIDYEDLEKLVDAGKVEDVIFSHWENAQEEMSSLMQNAHAEFGESEEEVEVEEGKQKESIDEDVAKAMKQLAILTEGK